MDRPRIDPRSIDPRRCSQLIDECIVPQIALRANCGVIRVAYFKVFRFGFFFYFHFRNPISEFVELARHGTLTRIRFKLNIFIARSSPAADQCRIGALFRKCIANYY